jgi:hypothetical protein
MTIKTEIIKTEDYQGFVTYKLYVNDSLWEWATVKKLYRDSEYYHTIDPDTNNIVSLDESEVHDYLQKMAYWEPIDFGLISFSKKKSL